MAIAKATGLKWLAGKILAVVGTLWHRIMFGPRVNIELDWKGSGIYVFDQPNPLWRAIKLTVTAGRDREFVIAAGAVDARSTGTAPNGRR